MLRSVLILKQSIMSQDFVAGCLGGAVGVVVGHPFDTVKVRLQTNAFHNLNAFQCAKMIIKKESVSGLYKGILSPLYGFTLMNSIVFGVQGNIQRRMPNKNSLTAHAAAGFVAGGVQSFVCSPVELARIRMQNQGVGMSYKQLQHLDNYYKGPIDCLWKIYKTEGIYSGVFRGLWVTIIREAPSFALYFPAFHGMCRYVTPSKEEYKIRTMLVSGGISGMLTWLSTFPADVIKTRFQDDEHHKYKNLRECTIHAYQEGGWRIFFKGLNVTLMRAFPSNAATMTVTTLFLHNNTAGGKDDY